MSGSKIGSGKQILNRILDQLSTGIVLDEEASKATDMLRAGLLYHCSTSDEVCAAVSLLKWGSKFDDEGDLIVQGIKTKDSDLLISDLIEELADDPVVKERVMARFPEISSGEYEAVMYAFWGLISSVQMYTELLEAETSEIDIDARVKSIMKVLSSK